MAKKILTQAPYATDNIQNQDDQVKGQAEQLKLAFDQGIIDQKTYNNTVHLVELQSSTPNDSGSHAIGFGSTQGNISSDNVGDALDEIVVIAKDAQLGEIVDNSLTEIKMANEMKKQSGGVFPYNDGISNKKRSIQNTVMIEELQVNASLTSKVPKSTETFYDYPGSPHSYSIGEVDLAKVFASAVTPGINTIVIEVLQSAKDGSTPANLSDCFIIGDEITLQDDTTKEVFIITNVDDGTKTLTLNNNIIGIFGSGANVYRSNLKLEGVVWKFGEFSTIIPNPNINTWLETLDSPTGIWDYMTTVGNDVYVRQSAPPYAIWKYSISSGLWEEGLAAANEAWNEATTVGTYIYVKQSASPYKIFKYDTLLNVWDKTLASPSAEWTHATTVGTDVYVRQSASPYRIWKYDTLLNTWDETLALPSAIWTEATTVGTDIYMRQGAAPYKIWKYDTLLNAWDETLATPSGAWDYATSNETDVYVKQNSAPYRIWKYDTLLDTWDETLAIPSSSWLYATSVGRDVYVRQSAAPYKIWKYDNSPTIVSGTKINDIDVRININPFENVSSIQAWSLLTDIIGITNTGYLSVVGSGNEESYSPLVNTDIDLGVDREFFSTGSVVTAETKVTFKTNLTRVNTTDDISVKLILGGVS